MVRQALGLLNGSAETALGEARSVQELRVDGYGGLWTRDYQAQPAQGGAAVTPSDSTVLSGVRALYVGGTGDLALVMADGTTPTLVGVQGGTLLPVSCTKVKAATTATSIVALT